MIDCFGFRRTNKKIWCSALTKMDCDGCNFYKSHDEKRRDDERTALRIVQLGCETGSYPLKFKE